MSVAIINIEFNLNNFDATLTEVNTYCSAIAAELTKKHPDADISVTVEAFNDTRATYTNVETVEGEDVSEDFQDYLTHLGDVIWNRVCC
jgi:hypothetical protein